MRVQVCGGCWAAAARRRAAPLMVLLLPLLLALKDVFPDALGPVPHLEREPQVPPIRPRHLAHLLSQAQSNHALSITWSIRWPGLAVAGWLHTSPCLSPHKKPSQKPPSTVTT